MDVELKMEELLRIRACNQNFNCGYKEWQKKLLFKFDFDNIFFGNPESVSFP